MWVFPLKIAIFPIKNGDFTIPQWWVAAALPQVLSAGIAACARGLQPQHAMRLLHLGHGHGGGAAGGSKTNDFGVGFQHEEWCKKWALNVSEPTRWDAQETENKWCFNTSSMACQWWWKTMLYHFWGGMNMYELYEHPQLAMILVKHNGNRGSMHRSWRHFPRCGRDGLRCHVSVGWSLESHRCSSRWSRVRPQGFQRVQNHGIWRTVKYDSGEYHQQNWYQTIDWFYINQTFNTW